MRVVPEFSTMVESYRQISSFKFESAQPPATFQHLDQVFFAGRQLSPSSGDILVRFGQKSMAFGVSLHRLRAMFARVKGEPSVAARFQAWKRLLTRVYGSRLGSATLFLKHTYLAILSRLLVTAALFPTSLRSLRHYRGIVDGEFFRNRGLRNFAEPDFFSWASETPVEADFVDFVQDLASTLGVYDFDQLEEDIFKELYPELVNPESRHGLGEYYTPDWLAELVLESIHYRGGKLLDPSCGSGSFLFAAIRCLRGAGLSGVKLVQTVLEEVIGIDVNPVAVLMAKANLLLGLRKEFREYGNDVSLRIYMADALSTKEDARRGLLQVAVSDNENASHSHYLRHGKVDYVVGNPPWLSYAFLKDARYKRRIKELALGYKLLSPRDTKLFTRIDTSTLFFVRTSEVFLKPDGIIAFVMPKNVILPAKQQAAFQQLGFNQIHDLTNVSPLFNIRACVLVRGPKPLRQGIPLICWSGSLPARDVGLTEARKSLSKQESRLDFPPPARPRSSYFERFRQGATLVPRCLCYLEPPPDVSLDVEAPFLRTSAEAKQEAKPQWRLEVNGQIERDFLFGTVLAKYLLPFVVRRVSLVALPLIETSHHDWKVVDSRTILGQGFPHAHDWFGEAERIWNRKRQDKKQAWQQRLNYAHLLTKQHLRAPCVVLYNQSGTNLCAALMTPDEASTTDGLILRGLVADSKTYFSYPASEEEAHYLVGILNTPVVNQAIKPYQPQGLLGERDIHRRPFEACPIPLFDANRPLHQRIADLARSCREELRLAAPRMPTLVAAARAEARRLTADKLQQLDELTAHLFEG